MIPTRLAMSIGALATMVALVGLPGCGDKNERPYVPKPAHSGKTARLPDVPTLPKKPIKEGDAYTVWGATHQLRSIVHVKKIKDKEVSLLGYVTKTNFADAPECAVHKTGKADPDGCDAPVPAIWISDEKGDTKNTIKVMGFASNFAQIYDAIENEKAKKEKPVSDEFFGAELPMPIPNVGAKVKITGTYGFSYTKQTRGIETDPRHGILTYQKIEFVEPNPEPAILPGMKR